MYAVIQAGGRQYKVSPGDTINVDFFEAPVGAEVTFDTVLMTGGDSTTVGRPYVDGVKVKGTVKAQGRGPKLIIFKKRRRHANSQTTRGFRAKVTSVEISSIDA
jgi:large subunit ribosomal protein L21